MTPRIHKRFIREPKKVIDLKGPFNRMFIYPERFNQYDFPNIVTFRLFPNRSHRSVHSLLALIKLGRIEPACHLQRKRAACNIAIPCYRHRSTVFYITFELQTGRVITSIAKTVISTESYLTKQRISSANIYTCKSGTADIFVIFFITAFRINYIVLSNLIVDIVIISRNRSRRSLMRRIFPIWKVLPRKKS